MFIKKYMKGKWRNLVIRPFKDKTFGMAITINLLFLIILSKVSKASLGLVRCSRTSQHRIISNSFSFIGKVLISPITLSFKIYFSSIADKISQFLRIILRPENLSMKRIHNQLLEFSVCHFRNILE